MKPIVGVIIQARLTSTRLPRKHLKLINGQRILEHLVERAHRASVADKVIIAAPHSPECCLNEEIFIGSEHDVLDRYYQAATKYHLDIVVRVTADCPFVPPAEINRVVNKLLESNTHYVTNRPAVPDGWDVEAFSMKALEMAWLNASDKYDREHVTVWMKRNEELNPVYLEAPKLSIDTEEDYFNVREFYELEREDYPDHRRNGKFRYQLYPSSSFSGEAKSHTDIFERRA